MSTLIEELILNVQLVRLYNQVDDKNKQEVANRLSNNKDKILSSLESLKPNGKRI